MMQRYKDARKHFERAIAPDHAFAEAYNNLGVVYYGGQEIRRRRQAIRQRRSRSTILPRRSSAIWARRYFSKKEFDQAVCGLSARAGNSIPTCLSRSSRGGVQAQLPGPEDRAHYDYTVAKLYAKMGFSDRSLEYLKKAMEEGYKDFKNVYKDAGIRRAAQRSSASPNSWPRRFRHCRTRISRAVADGFYRGAIIYKGLQN